LHQQVKANLLLLDFHERAVGSHDIFDEFKAGLLAVLNGTTQPQCAVFAADIIFTVEFTHAIQAIVQKRFAIHIIYHLGIL
jgi:hypothetical protein